MSKHAVLCNGYSYAAANCGGIAAAPLAAMISCQLYFTFNSDVDFAASSQHWLRSIQRGEPPCASVICARVRRRDEYFGLRIRLKSNPATAINIPVNSTVGPSGAFPPQALQQRAGTAGILLSAFTDPA